MGTLECSPINLRQYFNFNVCLSVCLSIKKPWGGWIKTQLFLQVFVLSFDLGCYFFNLEWVLNTLEHSPINLRQYFNFKVCPSVCLSINGSVLIQPPHGFLMTFFLKKSNFLNNSKYNPQNWSWWDVLNIKKEKLIGGVKFKLCSSGKGKPPNRPRLDSTPPWFV